MRNHTQEGTFASLTSDLDRIKKLGTDIIWFMPIHPVGQKNKKGSLGCPYSIKDYRGVNPEYGSLEDFQAIVKEIHNRGMKVIIDVVYNHTSHDALLLEEHPEFYYRKEDGSLGNKVGDWSDIIDLDYTNKALWDYQIETLVYWVKQGVDGFRCDVAPMVPMDFWKEARKACGEVKEDVIWLSESVEPGFITELRKAGAVCHTDTETFEAFDILYDYDIYPTWKAYLQGQASLEDYMNALAGQEDIYPQNYIKMRYVENHDQMRAAQLIPDPDIRRNWTAFTYFVKGCTLVYAGQEVNDDHVPSLFDKDMVKWEGQASQEDYLASLAAVRHRPELQDYKMSLEFKALPGVVQIRWDRPEGYTGQGTAQALIGLFNFEKVTGEYPLDLTGSVTDLLTGEGIQINSPVAVPKDPLILELN